MKAAVLYELNQPLQVVDGISIPDLRRGQVLVKLAYSGVCHSQLMEVRGRRGPDRFLPHLMGHEGTGRVEACGPGVAKVAPGDFVVLTWIRSSGLDAGGTIYDRDGQTIHAGGVTTFNEYAVVSENRCVPLPAHMPMDAGVLLGCAIPTGAGIVFNEIQPKAGGTAAVFGLGGIGLSALMAFHLRECRMCVAVDVEPEKLELARELGATHVVDASGGGAADAIRELTDGEGVDYCVEATGLAKGIEEGFSCIRKNGGLCVFASHPRHGDRISLDPFDLICGKQIRGSWGGASKPDRDIPAFVGLYRKSRLPLERLLSRRYSLDEINQALDDLEARKIARALLVIDPDLVPA
ncbi:MAG: zinc-binding dehydrogenase [Lentisphaerae bacterium]|nr:zinc-binding dehydrogenase [Lentisphaerota bacterium]